MDAMIISTIAPVAMTSRSNKDEKKTRRSDYKRKAAKARDDDQSTEEFAAVYQHDPYSKLSNITYKRPGVKGY